MPEKEFEGYLPSSQGRILANAAAESIDSVICLNKSTVMAVDNISLTLNRILESFKLEWQKDYEFEKYRQSYEDFKIRVETFSQDYLNHLNTEFKHVEGGLYACKTTIGLPLNKLLSTIDRYAESDTSFYTELRGMQFYEKIKRESEGIWSTAVDQTKKKSAISGQGDSAESEPVPPADSSSSTGSAQPVPEIDRSDSLIFSRDSSGYIQKD